LKNTLRVRYLDGGCEVGGKLDALAQVLVLGHAALGLAKVLAGRLKPLSRIDAVGALGQDLPGLLQRHLRLLARLSAGTITALGFSLVVAVGLAAALLPRGHDGRDGDGAYRTRRGDAQGRHFHAVLLR
jgi:hypothetical protein